MNSAQRNIHSKETLKEKEDRQNNKRLAMASSGFSWVTGATETSRQKLLILLPNMPSIYTQFLVLSSLVYLSLIHVKTKL